MSETTAAYGQGARTEASVTDEPPRHETGAFREKIPWEMILVWVVIVAALALVAAAAVLLFLGLLEMIAVVSPVLVAVLLVWTAVLTVKTVKLERRLRELKA